MMRNIVEDGMVEVEGSKIREKENGKQMISIVEEDFDEFRRDRVEGLSFEV